MVLYKTTDFVFGHAGKFWTGSEFVDGIVVWNEWRQYVVEDEVLHHVETRFDHICPVCEHANVVEDPFYRPRCGCGAGEDERQ
jgi:hypothetical protein